MKKLYWIIALGLLLAGGVYGYKKYQGAKPEPVTVEAVVKRDIIETVSASGKVQPEVEVKISSDVSGEIVELLVKEGEFVKKGDLLLRINPDLYVSAVNRMNATLNASRANLANTKARLNQLKAQFAATEATYLRDKKLFTQGVISQSDIERSQSAYESAKADMDAALQSINSSAYTVESTQASLTEAKDNLNKTTIYAPVSGTISRLNIELGERVVGTSQMAGTELLTIANLNEMEVRVDVNENDIVRLSKGNTALVDIDAYLDRKFKGVVTEIGNSANTTGSSIDQVTNFTVKVRLLQDSYADLTKNGVSPFRPGMSATVDIQTSRVRDVFAVPIQSVTVRNDSLANTNNDKMGEAKNEALADKKGDNQEQQEYVFVFDGKFVKQTPVKTGIQDDLYIQIISGLKQGDQVVSGPYGAISRTLKDGAKVVKVARDELFRMESKDKK